jgi:prenyl protein peptidase
MTPQLVGIGICIGLAFLYVSSLYVWELIYDEMKSLSRDHPDVIFRRSLSVIASSGIAWFVTAKLTQDSIRLPYPHWYEIARTIFQTGLLMLGPIVHVFVSQHRFTIDSWIIFRNIVLSPIAEEFVFRECFIRILVYSGFSKYQAGISSPLLFAVAHMHHNWSKLTIPQLVTSVAHTCIFGWIASYLLITRSVWDSIVSHAMCNAIGLPNSRVSNGPFVLVTYVAGLLMFILSTQIFYGIYN